MADRVTQSAVTRRGTLKSVGTLVGGGLFAGCSEQTASGGDQEPETVSAAEYPVVERWLGTDEVGGVDGSYDGSHTDFRDIENPEVTVGAEGNGGPVAMDPSAIIVSPGAVVQWVWTEHGHHNVVSDPETQLGESDRSFSSGDPVERENNLYTAVFDDPATILYQCEPHLDLGMKGAVVVEEG
jgi:halocyanin-like protein